MPLFKLKNPLNPFKMEKAIFQDFPPDKRFTALQDAADQVEKGTYLHRLNDDELAACRMQFTEMAMKLQNLEIEKKETVSDFNERLKEMKGQMDELLAQIKGQQVEKEGTLFRFTDPEAKTVAWYDSEGHFIRARKMVPGEQIQISKIRKLG